MVSGKDFINFYGMASFFFFLKRKFCGFFVVVVVACDLGGLSVSLGGACPVDFFYFSHRARINK